MEDDGPEGTGLGADDPPAVEGVLVPEQPARLRATPRAVVVGHDRINMVGLHYLGERDG